MGGGFKQNIICSPALSHSDIITPSCSSLAPAGAAAAHRRFKLRPSSLPSLSKDRLLFMCCIAMETLTSLAGWCGCHGEGVGRGLLCHLPCDRQRELSDVPARCTARVREPSAAAASALRLPTFLPEPFSSFCSLMTTHNPRLSVRDL